MNIALWGPLLVAVVCLLQIPAVILISRYFELDEPPMRPPMRDFWARQAEEAEAGPESEASADPGVDSPGRPRRPPGECPHCGTHNDPVYEFCQGCLARIGATER